MYFSLVSACAVFFIVEIGAKTTELTAQQIVKRSHEECLKETNATPEQTKILFNHAEVPKDDGERCFLECMYQKTGVIKDGKYDLEGTFRLIDLKYKGDEVALAKKVTSECAQKVAAKEGEKCYLGRAIRECIQEGAKDITFFPGA